MQPFPRSRDFLRQIAHSDSSRILDWIRTLPFASWTSEIYRATLDKDRDLVRLPDSIYLAEKALALDLESRIEPRLPDALCSFRKGRSAEEVIRDFASLGAAHGKAPLFVLRRDVENYTDSIPLGDHAPLWRLLADFGVPERDVEAIRTLLRAPVRARGSDREFSRSVGISTGSSLTPPIANLYLNSLDLAALGVPGAFYRRYGDDFVFAHSEKEVAASFAARIPGILKPLGLREKTEKSADLAWTSRGGPASTARFEERQYVDLLGIRVHRSRGPRLPPKKMKALLERFRLRMRIVRDEVPNESSDSRAYRLCRAAETQFGPGQFGQDPSFRRMRALCTDPGAWREFDREVCGTIALLAADRPLPYAFRDYSPRDLIRRFGFRPPGHLWGAYGSR
ncbi:MAG: hypothetical protein JST04_00415 [Bdellovibrionales bacterium]|nr:hypothetical protein [Bdellovibrionales bacterium]